MINENIYDKLTPSAKEALGELTEKFREDLLSKALDNAQKRDTANKEISLRDILDAKQLFGKLEEKEKYEFKIKRKTLLISISGAVYAIAGILIYLFQNNRFTLENDLGLIIAVIGILLSLISFLYGQINFKKDLFTTTSTFKSTTDYEIVNRWQIIETLAKQLMTDDDQREAKNNSVGFLIRFLSHKVAEDKKEFLQIRELLQIRNKILHEDYNLSDVDRKRYLDFADVLIQRLESSKDEHSLNHKTLKVIEAYYGTTKKRLEMTKELNQLISNNRLEFVLNNEIVGDPDLGTVKQLELTFEINGDRQTQIFNEGEKVIIH